MPSRPRWTQVVLAVLVLQGCVTLFASPSRAGALLSQYRLATHDAPASVFLADMDHDGNLDILAAASGQNAISYFHNLGQGSFAPAFATATGTNPVSIKAADVNLDGNLDVVTADFNGGTVTEVLGNGANAFSGPLSLAMASQVSDVVVADFNGDGFPDLACTSQGTDACCVRLRTGPGVYGAVTSFPCGSMPSALVALDVNGDGRMDLAVANSNASKITLLTGTGTGSFTPSSITSAYNGRGIAAADMNGDGRKDLVLVARDSLQIFVGTAGGGFASPRSFKSASAAGPIDVADLDGDGARDVIAGIAPGPYGLLVINYGDGVGNVGSNVYVQIEGGVNAARAGDVNQDGRPDVISVDQANDLTDVSLNLGSRVLGRAYWADASLRGAGVGDVTADGIPDIVASTSPSGAALVVRKSLGNGTFVPVSYTGDGIGQLVIADYDRDGYNDVAVGTGGNHIALWRGTSAGTLASPISTGSSSDLAHTFGGQLDDDALPDIVSGGVVMKGLGDGTVVATDTLPTRNRCAIGDVNRDGHEDLVGIVTTGDSLAVFPGDGAGAFGPGTRTAIPGSPKSVALADFDRDGLLDVAIACSANNTFLVLHGRADGTFESWKSFTGRGSPTQVAIADLNGDHNADLIVTDGPLFTVDSWSFGVYPGRGDGTFDPPQYYTSGISPDLIMVADFNHDGRPDVVAHAVGDNTFSVLFNVGGYVPVAVEPRVDAAPRGVAVRPNPGSGPVEIAWSMAHAGAARVEVFDLAGRRVGYHAATAAGASTWRWDGRGPDGRRVAPGVYLVRVDLGGASAWGRIIQLGR